VTVSLLSADGQEIALPVERWMHDATTGEQDLLAEVRGPALDIGCGPGRHLVALNCRGVAALGIDTSPAAVALACRRGATALWRSVFDPLPGEGRWRTVLLLDGNIGIGGDPVALLRRVRRLLAPAGTVLAEVEPGVPTERLTVRLQRDGSPGPRFPWARVGDQALERLAVEGGLSVDERWSVEGRCFASLTS